MKQTRQQEEEDNKRIVDEWMRHLHRALFSLGGEDAARACARSVASSFKDSQDAGRLETGRKEANGGIGGAGLSTQLLRALHSDIVDFHLGGFEQSAASSVPHANYLPVLSSSALPPIVCAMARSTDMQVLVAAAKWLEKQKEASRASTGTQTPQVAATARTAEAQRTNGEASDAAGNQSNERTRKRGDREREAGKEKAKDGGQDGDNSDSARKRLRSRASSASNKGKTTNDKADKNKNANAEERSVQDEAMKGSRPRKEEGGGTEKDDAVLPLQKRARFVRDGEDVSQHIALCLLHRKAVQRSVPSLCQTLLHCFDTSAASSCVVDEGAEGMHVQTSPAAQRGSKGHRNEKPNQNEKATENVDGVKGTREEGDEEAAREKLRLLEEKLSGLHKQLSAQSERTRKQHGLVRRLQEKQDLDTARARQQGNRIHPYLSSREGDAAKMMASSAYSFSLLSSFNDYVNPAILGLQLHAAKKLCDAANEARVLVAMLLSEQARLRASLDDLHDKACTALGGKATAVADLAQQPDSIKVQPKSASDANPAILNSDRAASLLPQCSLNGIKVVLSGAEGSAVQPPGGAAGNAGESGELQTLTAQICPTSPRAASRCDKNQTEAVAAAEVCEFQGARMGQLQQQVEIELDDNAALLSEMKTAGVPSASLDMPCVDMHGARHMQCAACFS